MTGKTRMASCHCGAVRLEVDLPDGLPPVERCNCTFCARRGAAVIGVPLEALRVVQGAKNLTLYTWNTGVAQHYFCRTCGIYTHHRRRANPQEYGVNVANLEGVDPSELGEIVWTDGRYNHPSDA